LYYCGQWTDILCLWTDSKFLRGLIFFIGHVLCVEQRP